MDASTRHQVQYLQTHCILVTHMPRNRAGSNTLLFGNSNKHCITDQIKSYINTAKTTLHNLMDASTRRQVQYLQTTVPWQHTCQGTEQEATHFYLEHSNKHCITDQIKSFRYLYLTHHKCTPFGNTCTRQGHKNNRVLMAHSNLHLHNRPLHGFQVPRWNHDVPGNNPTI
jgi:hypothetical protein